ncbi:MAG TPA: DUF1175 family protein, partial [Spirochaetota bacterium]|nr:DUF1175 family protein [Spirochaetota bacterium]
MTFRERRFAGLAIGAGILVLSVVGIMLSLGGGSWGVSHTSLAANGVATTRILIPDEDGVDPSKLLVRPERGLVRVVSLMRTVGDDGIEIVLVAGYAGGEETIRVTGFPGGEKTFRITLSPVPVDLDGDGIPDAAELRSVTDRLRFRTWFCAIAESQFYRIWDSWIPEQRDCAGLVRFAMREALVVHNERWLSKAGKLLLRTSIPDVQAWNYPDVPFLGTKLFRTKTALAGGEGGTSFSLDDFAPFVTARLLLDHNCVTLGKDLTGLEAGDLLFFHQDDLEVSDQDEAMHVMVWLGNSSGEPMLVYHTGDRKAGQVRKLSLKTLQEHPDMRWRP